MQGHLQAAQGAPGGDVPAHDPGTDDVHAGLGAGFPAAQGLQALLQEEHAHEVARRAPGREPRDRLRLLGEHAALVTPVALEEIDEGIGRRVVRGRGAFLHLAAQVSAEQWAQRFHRCHARHEARPVAGRGPGGMGQGRGTEVALGHCAIHEPEALGGARIDRAPAQHEVHGRRGPDEPDAAHGAAEAGMDAEQDLGQPEAGAGVVHRHPIAQRERQLHPPAEAKALDGRDRRERQGLDAIEGRMPELDQRERRLSCP